MYKVLLINLNYKNSSKVKSFFRIPDGVSSVKLIKPISTIFRKMYDKNISVISNFNRYYNSKQY